MATQNLIQIKRSQATAVPPSLANGELAWSANGDTLWIGNFGTVTPVGGEGYILDLVQGGNFDIFANTITAASDLIAQTQLTIDQFSVNGIVDDINLTSNTTLITSQAIKDYVDSQFGNLANTIVFDDLNDVSVASASNNDYLVYDGTDWVNRPVQDGLLANTSGLFVITGTGVEIDGNNAVRIGQPVATTDSVTFANVTASGTITGSNGAALTATSDNQVVIERDNGTGLRFRGKDIAGANVQSYAGIFYNQAYGTTNATKTRLIVGSNEDMSLELQTSNEMRISAVDDNTGGGKVRIASGDGSGSPHAIEFHPGTQAEVDNLVAKIDTSGLEVIGNITANSINVSGDATISGNLFVEGTLTQIDTEQLKIEDNLIKLASNNTTDSVDIGFYGPYDPGTGQLFTGLYRDASDGTFKFFDSLDGNTSPITTIGGSAELAPIAVGGLTIDNVNTAFISVGGSTGSAYQMLQLDAAGLPTWGSLDGGTF